jgi:hypothetical protein
VISELSRAVETIPAVYKSALLANIDQLESTRNINATRRAYLEMKQRVAHMGIAIPPSLRGFEAACGWSFKGVKALNNRIKLTGFAAPGLDIADFEIDKIWAANRLGIESPHAHWSAIAYGPSFLVVMRGDQSKREPKAIIRHLSPLNTTAIYNPLTRRNDSGLTVNRGEGDSIKSLILYTEETVVTGIADGRGGFQFTESRTLGHCPIYTLAFDATPDNPFGRSRVSQAVMNITDKGIRTSLRMEVGAEFYSAPQRYLLGADESAFTGPNGEKKTGWDAVMGRLLAIARDEDGQIPEVGQFAQMSMQPHIEMMREIASEIAGELNLPVGTLGIVHDNPSSDAAMHTAYLDLNADAEASHEPFGAAWVDAMKDAVVINGTGTFDDLELLAAKWRDPATPTKASASAAAVALVTAGILPPDSDVTLEMVGFDQVTIDRISEHRRNAQAANRMQQLVDAARSLNGGGTTEAVPAVNAGAEQSGESGPGRPVEPAAG